MTFSRRDKAAQLLFPRLGSNMPPAVTVEEDAARLEQMLERCAVGGVVLFNGTLAETPEALTRLQALSRYPLLVATDMERGVGQQVRGATVFPHAMAFSAMGGAAEEAVEAAARVAAREALACGIHITFAPVADVNHNPHNPIIATRAFSTEPQRAATLVRAYIRGCQAEGLLTTAKHFPGHGGTREDSHETVPVVSSSRETLAQVDLAPFAAAIEAGVDLVMTAHVAYPALDPNGLPATRSRPILRTLLREEMGFTGAVVTDSLLMGAIRESSAGIAEQAVALLQAGVDLLLDVSDPEAVVEGLVQAVEAGRLEEARLDEAFSRVRVLKQRFIDRFDASFFSDPTPWFPREEVGSPAHLALAADCARRAVTVVKDEAGILPFQPETVLHEGLLVILVKPHRTRLDPPEQPLGQAVRTILPGSDYVEVGPESDEQYLASLLERAGRARHVVVALVVKPAAWHGFGLLPAQRRFVATLVTRQPVALAALGTPVVLEGFSQAVAQLCTYSDVAASQEALAAVLAGQEAPTSAR